MSGFSPISFMFIASGIGRRARLSLTRFKPSQVNAQSPSWNGTGEFTTQELSTPITDKSYWEGRYVLTELTLEKADGERLVINDAEVSISRSMNIVRTALVGLEGTVKEYIYASDYEIQINVGIVAVEDGKIVDKYPEEGVRVLKRFLDEPRSIKIQSVFFDLFDIDNIVIEKLSLTQQTASNRQVVEVRALSDKDYVIYSSDY